MKYRNKSSSQAFLLTALLPVAEFLHPSTRMCSLLSHRLIHHCLDLVLQPLKQAAEHGRMVSDSWGNLRLCYTILAAYIADTPEAGMLACVRGRTSHLTTASHKQFGDSFRHEPRHGSTTLAQLNSIDVDPSDLQAFFDACQQYRLSGVHLPFWRNWPLSDPCIFLTPEILHQCHGEFYDHELRWCLNLVGAKEIDFRYSILQPVVGFRRFKGGISNLKQVTGRMQREIQRYLIAIIAGAAPPAFIRALRALMDLRYLSQATSISEHMRLEISNALEVFHDNKDIITVRGARRGPKTKKVLPHFRIPKLELMQNMAPSTADSGAPIQWSADTTEHLHITVIKEPAEASNNQEYDAQICRFLDRLERCRLFDDAVKISQSATCPTPMSSAPHAVDNSVEDDLDELPNAVVKDIWEPHPQSTDFFSKARHLEESADPVPRVWPPRTFIAGCAAIRLNYNPSIKRISVDDAAEMFGLEGLRAALADYLEREQQKTGHKLSHQRHAPSNANLFFDDLQVWYKLRIQQHGVCDPLSLCPALTINAMPPSQDNPWKFGRYDKGIFVTDSKHEWPASGLSGKSIFRSSCGEILILSTTLGHVVAEVKLIMRPLPPKGMRPWWANQFLVYAERLDIAPQRRGGRVDPDTQMHVLNRAKHRSSVPMGGILPLHQLRSYAPTIPVFDDVADPRLTAYNSSHYAHSFYLNKYFDKEFYYSLHLSEANQL